MEIAKGVSLGPYEIVSHLGSGGMGEVWRARDHRLRRDVAVKVLPKSFASGNEQLQRFEQEARAAGGLNHPGLVTIFDVGTIDGAPYIVMELLEGESLRDALGDPQPVALPVRKAIDYAIQAALALAVAHEKGIIHRDLKPENIFVTPDRRVKILDFGLAKLAPDSNDPDGRRRTSRHLTSTGFVVGTPGYMSPEQVRAAPIDQRTDIFSLGSILYEMLVGRPAFERASAVETMHAVLNDELPPLEGLNLSPELEATVHHCMEKNPRDRFQSARDLAFHLRSLPEANKSTATQRLMKPARKRLVPATLALAGLLGASATGVLLFGMRRQAPPGERTFRQLTSADGLEVLPTLAPDGKSFAYVSAQSGNRDIYVQRVDGRTAINVTSDSAEDDSEPAFSPDGSQIAFRSERGGGGIFVMGATGESPLRLTDFGHNPAWSPDGTKLAVASEQVELRPFTRGRTSELWIVDARNGARRPLVQAKKGGPDFGSDSDSVQPSWSPHGKRIAVWGVSAGQRSIWTIDPNAPEPKKTAVRVVSGTTVWNPVWSPDGKYLYYGSDGDGTLNLWRVAIDEETGALRGTPESVVVPAPLAGDFTFARSGEMAYVAETSLHRMLAIPFDANAAATGAPRQILGGSQEIVSFAPSPDGRRVAYTTGGATQEDVFVADADGTHIRQLTNDPARDRSVEWSPDATTLYFYSNREGSAYRIWSIRADGSALTLLTGESDVKRAKMPNIFTPVPSPDGHTLLVEGSGWVSALLHLERPPGQRLELLPVFLNSAKWSPDGQFIVARDQPNFVVQQVASEDMPGAIILYSLRTRRAEKLSENGSSPHWTPDGKKIVYFGQHAIQILDLESRSVRTAPFTLLSSAEIDLRRPAARLSRDAATLYVRQVSHQGDVWLMRFPAAR